MNQQETTLLKNLLLEDLTQQITYDGINKRSRVRKPESWKKLSEQLSSITNVTIPSYDRNTWVWSDLHFGHSNILDFSDRPFENVDQMNNVLVDNFNDCVNSDDISIWVGDISFLNNERTNEILDSCNGYKILVVGNHDLKKGKLKNMNFNEVHVLYLVDFPDLSLVFTHYPMFNLIEEYPYINVHGHLHINHGIDSIRHINVCCEYHNYRPVNLNEIYQWAKIRKESLGYV